MHVVIMGCGRVGSMLATRLDRMGHSVAIIDMRQEVLDRLPRTFSGVKIMGMGFDRDTLCAAGIERATAFAAVSSGDNSNIISARVARETFGVKDVVARIYDPRRAAIYQRLGIPTVASVAWSTDQILRRLLPLGTEDEWRDPSGAIALAEVHLDPSWVGHNVGELALSSGARIAIITRLGVGILPTRETVLQENDLVHALFEELNRERVERVFSTNPSAKESEGQVDSS